MGLPRQTVALLEAARQLARHLPADAVLLLTETNLEWEEVLEHLGNVDLEPGIWLRRLTHDPAPEVRVAAIRAAKEPPLADLQVDLSDRIDQILQNDPSPTVRQQAGYYSGYPIHQPAGTSRP